MTWAYYLLQVNIYLVIFYAFYKLLLDRETYFILNRIYLIAAGILSLIIPFLKPEWFVRQVQTSHLRINIDQLNMMMTNVTISDEADQFNWGHLVAGIYISGILFFICRFIVRLLPYKNCSGQNLKEWLFLFSGRKLLTLSFRDWIRLTGMKKSMYDSSIPLMYCSMN